MSATPVQVRGQQSRPDSPMAQSYQGGIQHKTRRDPENTKRISDTNVLNRTQAVNRVFHAKEKNLRQAKSSPFGRINPGLEANIHNVTCYSRIFFQQ